MGSEDAAKRGAEMPLPSVSAKIRVRHDASASALTSCRQRGSAELRPAGTTWIDPLPVSPVRSRVATEVPRPMAIPPRCARRGSLLEEFRLTQGKDPSLPPRFEKPLAWLRHCGHCRQQMSFPSLGSSPGIGPDGDGPAPAILPVHGAKWRPELIPTGAKRGFGPWPSWQRELPGALPSVSKTCGHAVP